MKEGFFKKMVSKQDLDRAAGICRRYHRRALATRSVFPDGMVTNTVYVQTVEAFVEFFKANERFNEILFRSSESRGD